MAFYHVVATDLNNVIGIDNQIPWKSKLDMRFFREITRDQLIVMGSNTYRSISKGEGPESVFLTNDRTVVVLSNSIDESQVEKNVKVIKYDPKQKQLDLERLLPEHAKQDVYIVGGQTIYEKTRHLVDVAFRNVIDFESPKEQPNTRHYVGKPMGSYSTTLSPTKGPKVQVRIDYNRMSRLSVSAPAWINVMSKISLHSDDVEIRSDHIFGLAAVFKTIKAEERVSTAFEMLYSLAKEQDAVDLLTSKGKRDLGDIVSAVVAESGDFGLSIVVGKKDDGDIILPVSFSLATKKVSIKLDDKNRKYLANRMPLTCALSENWSDDVTDLEIIDRQIMLFLTCLAQLILSNNTQRNWDRIEALLLCSNAYPTLAVITGVR